MIIVKPQKPPQRPRLTFAEYQALPQLNHSGLEEFRESPWRYYQTKYKGAVKPPTPEQEFGRLTHAFVLEGREEFYVTPETYTNNGSVKPWSNNANVCRAWNEEHADRTIISASEYSQLRVMRDSLLTHKHAGRFLRDAVDFELTLTATHPEVKQGLKGRMDCYGLTAGAGWLLDLKTVRSASTAALSKMLVTYGYHRQAAWYLDLCAANGLDIKGGFYFAAVEKSDPPQINVRRLSDMAIQLGRDQNRRDIQALVEAEKLGLWPDYSGSDAEPGTVDLPEWVYNSEAAKILAGCEMED